MPQYDGSIRIGTKIETKGFKAGSKELESEACRMAKTVSKDLGDSAKIALQKQTDAFVKLNQQYSNQEQKVKNLASKLHDLQRQKVETEEFKKLSKDLDKAKASLDRLYERRDSYTELGKKTPPKLGLDISDAERKIRILEADIKELTVTGKAYLPVDTTKVQNDLAAAEQKQMQMYTALQTSADALTQKTSERVAKEESVREKIEAEAKEEERLGQIRVNAAAANDEIIDRVERIKELEQEISDLKAAGITQGYADYDDRIQELSTLKQEVKEYEDSLLEVPEKFARMRASAQKAFNAMVGGFSTLKKAGEKTFSGIISMSRKAFSGISFLAKKAFDAVASGTKKSTGLLSAFASRLKGLALSLLIFNWISKAFNAMISGMKTGFTNFMNYSDSFANSVQGMKNAMSTLGNQFAAAFSPIVQMIIPWLTKLINAISTAMTYVAQFIAILGGKSTFTRAKQVQDKYNKSLNNTAKAADKARGALARFDDLDVLQKKEDDTGTGGVADAMGDLFEEVPISDKLKDVVQRLKEMWENSDFYELGKLLGEKLKEALDSIPWDAIKEIARKIGKSIASFINGFIEVEGLGESIGRTLAEALNSAFEFFNTFVHELHWDSIGKFISETINGFFQNIDWDLIYDTLVTAAKGFGDAINAFADNLDWGAIATAISKFINTIVDTIYEFITTTDWIAVAENFGKTLSDAFTGIDWTKFGETVGEAFKAFFDFISTTIENIDWWAVGESVKDFLVGIDWAGVAESFFEAVGTAIGGFAAFIGGLIADGIEEAKQYFQDKIEEAGGNVVEGIFNGIIEAVKDIGSWINEHIFQPFIEGFKEAFGIHSPSTVMAEMGGYLIEGLINGIKDMWGSLKDTISEIADSIVTKFKDILGIHSPSTVMEDQGNYITEGLLNGISGNIGAISELWSGLKEDMVSTMSGIGEWFSDFWTSTFEKVSAILQNVKATFSNTWTAIRSTAISAWTGIQNWFSSFWNSFTNKIRTTWNSIVNFFSDTWKNITSIFQKFIDFVNLTVISSWKESWSSAENIFNSFKSVLTSIISSITTIFDNFFGKTIKTFIDVNWKGAWENARNIFTAFKDKIVEIIDVIKGILESFFKWISDILSKIIGKIKDIGSSSGDLEGSAKGGERSSAFSGAYSARNLSGYIEDLPHLASGSVIRGGNPFMAILGDQPAGKVNVETPASLIKDMVAQGISEAGIGRESVPVTINLNYDGETFARLSISDILSELGRQGYNVDVLGVR